jgi:GNAT superfamily N-acetyltransferase
VATFRVERVRSSRKHAEDHTAIATLARAFHDDPLFNFFMADHVKQAHGLLTFMGAGYADARPFDEIWGARTENDKFAGAAVWLPPGAYPRSAGREAMTYVRATRTFKNVGRQLAASVRLLTAVDKAHHEIDVPHWYLAILGVDPSFQGSGAGTALLQPVLRRCDEEGVVAYLETQKPENVPWYGRQHFEVVDKLEVRGCPPIWTLLREPRPAG